MTGSWDAAGFRRRAPVSSADSMRMTLKRHQRRVTDTLLLCIWVIGYYLLIRTFAALQRFERLLASPKREGTREVPRT